MSYLFDVRAYPNSKKRYLHLSDPRGVYVATVNAVKAGAIGEYVDGTPYQPDNAAVEAALPHQWRKAFARRGANWWFNQSGPSRPCYTTLYDLRDNVIATLYATFRNV